MSKEEKVPQFTVLKSLFLDGSIKSMRDIEKIFPTYIGQQLGLNHSRYIDKLRHPALFKIDHIILLAEMIDVKPQIIMTVILNQIAADKKKKAPPKR